MAFPKKKFTWDDMETPLKELGFGSSAALIVEKSAGGSSVQQGFTEYERPTGTIKEVATKAEFFGCLKKYERVAVDFTASWCGPCKHIGPEFERLAPQYPTIQFVKVDVDENDETAHACEVRAMPTFHFYKVGKKVSEFSGANKDNLVRSLDQLKS